MLFLRQEGPAESVRPPPESNDTRQRPVSPEAAVICFGSTCSFVPQAAIGRSFDHLVGARGLYRRNVKAERFHLRFRNNLVLDRCSVTAMKSIADC